MRTILFVLCLGCFESSVHADTFETRSTFGLEAAALWNRDVHGAGLLYRFEESPSSLPSWLGLVARAGTLFASNESVFTTLDFGLLVRPFEAGPYAALEGGLTCAPDPAMENVDLRWRIDLLGTAALGYRAGAWDLRVSAAIGGPFDGTTWLVALGRDFWRFDSTIERTKL